MSRQHAEATFTVDGFTPVGLPDVEQVATALGVDVTLFAKHFAGDVQGRSVTVFTSAYDQHAGLGTYLAMESFEGTVHGAGGTFNFLHVASTAGQDRFNETFLVVPSSGTGGLAGIAGDGGMRVEPDGTHRIWFDYTLD